MGDREHPLPTEEGLRNGFEGQLCRKAFRPARALSEDGE